VSMATTLLYHHECCTSTKIVTRLLCVPGFHGAKCHDLSKRTKKYVQNASKRVRETKILVKQQPPQGVLVCDHAGLVINRFSLKMRNALTSPEEDFPMEHRGETLYPSARLSLSGETYFSLV